jgi:hypothetical protein
MRERAKSISYEYVTPWIDIENCVSSNSRDYGRTCQAERKALSDCAEKKYKPMSAKLTVVLQCLGI